MGGAKAVGGYGASVKVCRATMQRRYRTGEKTNAE